jgi:hypothetical protein
MQKLGDPLTLKARIGSITSGGGTNIYSGLSPAVDALIASKAKSKHIVLLTDGVSEPGDYDGLLKKMAANGVTLSTVAVGADADVRLMQYLAVEGKGRYYYTEDGNALPQIFAHESHLASRSYIIEHTFSPERTSSSPILDGIGSLPALQGYVGTSPRPAGQVVLVSDAGDPLLAQWQYGLGRVIAWTSDAKGQWAREWVSWSEFARFWSQAVRWSTGTEASAGLQSRVELEAGAGEITVEAAAPDGSYLNDLSVQAAVVAPGLLTTTVDLKQSAAGRYEGTFPALEEGAYLIRIEAQGAGLGTSSQTIGAVVPYTPEYRGADADTGLLPRIASLSGGRELEPLSPALAFDRNLPPVRSSTSLWPLLLTLAILLLPLDVGVRRVSIYRSDLARFVEEARRRLGISPRPAPALSGASTPGMAAHFGARDRMRQSYSKREDRQFGGARQSQTANADLEESRPWARDLQISGRAARSGEVAISAEKQVQPVAEAAQAEQVEGNTLAARLRKARDERQ